MAGPPAEPFFLAATPGQRFCMYYAAAAGASRRGALLYVHPYGEEMHKSRRMAALQARAFAAQGYSVLQIDLYGCGDSSGDFGQARWHVWKHDLLLACRWLQERDRGPLSLWGLRLGATLALDLAHQAPLDFQRLILWYPVLNGAGFVDQLLRQHLAAGMLDRERDQAGGTPTPRQLLAAGASVEVGGYALAPELAESIAQQDMLRLAPTCPVLWFEHCLQADGVAGPVAARHASAWRDGGTSVHLHAVHGAPFWSSAEIVDCPALLAATAAGAA